MTVYVGIHIVNETRNSRKKKYGINLLSLTYEGLQIALLGKNLLTALFLSQFIICKTWSFMQQWRLLPLQRYIIPRLVMMKTCILPPSFPGAKTVKFLIPGNVRRYICNYTK